MLPRRRMVLATPCETVVSLAMLVLAEFSVCPPLGSRPRPKPLVTVPALSDFDTAGKILSKLQPQRVTKGCGRHFEPDSARCPIISKPSTQICKGNICAATEPRAQAM